MSEDFDKLVRDVKQKEGGFVRIMTCKLYPVSGGILAVSRFSDRFHDIEMAVEVGSKNFTITNIGASMNKIPYEICRETVPGLQKLNGLFIFHPAVNREVRRHIKRKEGCTHIFELLEFTLVTLFAGGPSMGLNDGHAEKPIPGMPPEEHRKLQMANPRLRDTCLAFACEE